MTVPAGMVLTLPPHETKAIEVTIKPVIAIFFMKTLILLRLEQKSRRLRNNQMRH